MSAVLAVNDPLPAIHAASRAQTAGPELSIVVPTFKESANVAKLVDLLERALANVRWEVIFVDDDSPDGTAEIARAIARRDARVRCVQRIGRRGLSSACVEGMLASAAPYVAVMDADLQHDEALLGPMLDLLKSNACDVVVGSRYIAGGGIGRWDRGRARASRLATWLARVALKAPIHDPMSGFFMIRAEVIQQTARRLSAIGFKILLDILASAPAPLRVRELPYSFRERHAGASKLDTRATWDYLVLILDKTVGRFVPVRFLVFSMVGGLGLIVHFAVLALLFKAGGASFVAGQTAATLAAMTFNFAVNNVLTYRDMRLSGWRWLRGWATFTLACGIGALANVGIANYLFQHDGYWVVSAVAGIVVGAVWNYAVTRIYTWKA
jgi:dolichol-phosphate mannosyltransferase